MIRVIIIAHPHFVSALQGITSRLSNADPLVISSDDPLWRRRSLLERLRVVRGHNIVHFFGGHVRIFDLLVYRLLGRVRIINHFMGTDLHNMLQHSTRKRLELKLCSGFCTYCVVGYILADELKELGIAARTVHIMRHDITRRDYRFPDRRSAIAYLPSKSREFYNCELLRRLAIDYPDVPFVWFPYTPADDEDLPANVACRSFIEPEQVIPEMEGARVFLRLPRHDGGAPLTLIEALSIGRWAIWSFHMDHTQRAGDYEELKNVFSALVDKKEPNRAGEACVLERFNMNSIVEGFAELYDAVG